MRKIHNQTFAQRLEPEFNTFMQKAELVRWSPASINYDKIDYRKLTLADLFAVFVTLHIENYSDVYTKLLLDSYPDMPLIRNFTLNWEREEENHARVLEKYLMTVGIPLEELRANYAKVNKEDFPVPSRNQTGLNVFVFFQELLTREMYTKMLKQCKEPVLVDILKRVVRDEERHYRFYKTALGLRKDIDKSDTLRQFRKVVRIFGMPQTMFRQKAMTDRLMEYYQYDPREISAIANPICNFLEASPSRWLTRFPRLQNLWQMRRVGVYLPQSPYLWGHLAISLKNRLGMGSVPLKDKQYVESVVARLEGLLKQKLSEIPVHDGLAASASGVADSLIAHRADLIREGLENRSRRVHPA